MGELISKLVDEAAIKKQLDAVKTQLTEIVKLVETLGGKGVVVFKNSGEVKNVSDAVKELQKLDQIQKQIANVNGEVNQTIIKETQLRNELNRLAKLEIQSKNEQIGAYKQLDAQALLATNHARDMAAQFGINSKEFQNASQDAIVLNKRLKDIDATMGNNQRNVGNYKDATMSLRTEVRTLTQTLAGMEMRGEGNSTQFKAMVQRLGEVKDAMGDVQARAKFFADDARWITATSQAVQGLVGAFAAFQGVAALVGKDNEDLQRSMQKLQAVMSIMMGLKQVEAMLNKDSFVKSAISVLWDKTRAIFIKKKTDELNKNTIALVANNAAENTSGKTIAATTEVVKSSTGALKGAGTAAASVGSSFGLVAAGAAAAVAALAGLVYGMITFNKSQLEAKEDTKEWKEQQQLLRDAIINTRNALNGTITSIGSYIEALRKKGKSEKELINDSIAMAKIQAETLALSYEAYGKQAIAERIDLEFQKKALESRKAYSRENEGLTLSEIQDLNDINMAIAEKKATEKDYYASARAVRIAANKAVIETTALIKEEEEAAKLREVKLKEETETKKKEIEVVRAGNIERLKSIGSNMTLIEAYEEQGRAVWEAWQMQKHLYTEEQLVYIFGQKYVDGMNDQTRALISFSDAAAKIPDVLAKNGTPYTDSVMADINQGLSEEEIALRRREAMYEASFQVIDSLSKSAFSTIAAYQKQNNDEILSDIAQSFSSSQTSIQNLLDAGIISQEEYESRSAALAAQRDKRIREENRRIAKQQRDMALFQAIINTAAGAASALIGDPYTAAIRVGLVLALGAIEIATIAAQPLPAFAKGRKGGSATDAIVGEKGWEYVQTATGNLYKSPDAATLTHLNSGDSVYSHTKSVELEKMLSLPKHQQYISTTNSGNLELIGKFDELTAAVKNKPAAIINMDKHGYSFMLANGNRQQRFVNNHIRYKA